MIENRGQIEKKHAEHFVKIFYILEENGKRAQNKSNADAKDKKDYDGNKRKQNMRVDYRLFVCEEVVENDKTHEH